MAYVVPRKGGRWEIRESVATERGPRARTLASFRSLTPEVVDRAVRAASRPLTPNEVYEAAQRAGAVSAAADAAARTLAAEIAAGRPPSPGLRRLVAGMLSERPPHDLPGGGVVEWLGASPARRGETLVDVLSLVDAMPPRPRPTLRFPPLHDQSRGRP